MRAFPHHKTTITALLGAALLLTLTITGWWFSERAPEPASGTTQIAQVDNLRVALRLDDQALGPRIVEVQVQDINNQPVPLDVVHVRFTMAEMNMGTIEAEAKPVRTGYFQAQGQFFTMAGQWNVEVTLQRNGQAPIHVPFALAVAAPGEASGPLNPLTPDQPTLAAGRQIYQAQCTVCHGVSGKGDGPAAIGLRPAPSDFTQHMQPGKHTNGQTFLWIKDGYPNSAMPAWGQRLSDEQIWQLVTYLRTFAQPATTTPGNSTTQLTSVPTVVQATAVPQVGEPLPPLIFSRMGNIWQSDGTGQTPRQLTHLAAGLYAEYPTLAPDSKQIAFIATTQGPIGSEDWPLANPQTSLYVMRADGTEQRLLWQPERGRLGLTAWEPGSTAIYVEYYDILSASDAPVPDRAFQIIRLDPGTGERVVAMKDAYDLTFSRDGKLMAFLRWHADLAAFTLNVAASDGTNEREILPWHTFSDYYAPRFSPDGQQIIFASATGPATDPAGYPLKAHEPSLVDGVLALLAPPAAEAHGAISYLWMVKTDGSGLRRLRNVSEDTPMTLFTSDGKQLVMMGNGGIYLMNADGSGLHKIDAVGDHGGLDWWFKK